MITSCDPQGQADLDVEDAHKPESLSAVTESPFPLAVLTVSPGVKGCLCVLGAVLSGLKEGFLGRRQSDAVGTAQCASLFVLLLFYICIC